MKIVVHELTDSLSQTITPDKITNVVAFRLHLYKHNSPSGSLYIELRDSGDNLVSTSELIEISSISEASFFHGQVRFYITAQLNKAEEYSIVLKSTDYSFSESAYIGWCADFDFHTYPSSYDIPRLIESPLDYEVWAKS